MITKPMLAVNAEGALRFPLLATPKLDGIRCLVVLQGGRKMAVSRNFKPIQNDYIRRWVEAHCPVGFDGELMLKHPAPMNFQAISSAVMKRTGEPDFVYMVFDYVKDSLAKPYSDRINDLGTVFSVMAGNLLSTLKQHATDLQPVMVHTQEQLDAYEATAIQAGFEGVMVRKPSGPYKLGRSSNNEGYLLKIKRFEDSEAVILEVKAQKHNENVAMRDELGRTRRSSSKEGITFKDTLGGFVVRDLKTGVEFSIGSGLDDAQRKELWVKRDTLPGQLLKYKFQPTGVKEAPRFPIVLGIRSAADMSA